MGSVFAENIKKYRTALSLTQEALGDKIGVSGQAVSKWESSDSMPDTAILPEIASALSVSIDTLFGYKSGNLESALDAASEYIKKDDAPESCERRAYDIITNVFSILCGADEDKRYAPGYMVKDCYNSDRMNAVAFGNSKFSYMSILFDPADGTKSLINEKVTAFVEAIGDSDVRRCVLWLMENYPSNVSNCSIELDLLIKKSGAVFSNKEKIVKGLEAISKGRICRLYLTNINGIDYNIVEYYPIYSRSILSILAAAFAETSDDSTYKTILTRSKPMIANE